MRNRIFSQTGILRVMRSIVLDRAFLWRNFGCEERARAAGYEVVYFNDSMKLRRYYEWDCQDQPDVKRIMVVDCRDDFHIPYDIARCCLVVNLSFRTVFPILDGTLLAQFPGLDFDHLAFIADELPPRTMDKSETSRFLFKEMNSPRWARGYAEAMLDRAVKLSQTATSHRDWTPVAVAFGKASMFHHSSVPLADYAAKRARIESAFAAWIDAKYAMLSGSVDSKRPVLLSKVNDFIRKGNEKVALIVMDGMSFENFFALRRMYRNERFSWDIQASFSFFPTVTSVARQSLFSGKLPQEHARPFSLDNEEKQWFEWWQAHGYRKHEIAFFKNKDPNIEPHVKVVGIVVDICDHLMHNEVQGLEGLMQGLENWESQKALAGQIRELQLRGFAVYMTADHGNTSAIAEGRFTKPGVLAEPASRRAVIYQSFADAIELAKFSTLRYSGTYLPEGCTAYLFEDGKCYGDPGTQYITHGGMTLEETVVPFVRIGDFYG